MGFKQKMRECRNSKKCRMGIIITLMIVVVILYFVWEKAKYAWAIAFVMLSIALWVEGFNYDFDIQKFIQTGWDYQASRVETFEDDDGNTIKLITGNCNRQEFDLDCKDFSTQQEAQAKYQSCADEVQQENPSIDVKKLDIYGLDWDNDGIVCEALSAH